MTRFSGMLPAELSYQEYKKNKYEFWALLRTLKGEYDKQYTGHYEPSMSGMSDSFDKYVEKHYGIKMFIHSDGKIDGTYEIVDEGKYAWCILKHT